MDKGEFVLDRIQRALRVASDSVVGVLNDQEALDIRPQLSVELAFLDIKIPGMPCFKTSRQEQILRCRTLLRKSPR